MQRLVAILCSTHAILSIRGKQRAHSHAFIRSGHIQYTHSAEKRFPVFPSHFFFSSPLSESCQCHQYPFASLYSLNRRAREEGKRGIGWVPPPPPTSLGRRGAAAAAATNAKREEAHTKKWRKTTKKPFIPFFALPSLFSSHSKEIFVGPFSSQFPPMEALFPLLSWLLPFFSLPSPFFCRHRRISFPLLSEGEVAPPNAV